MFDIPKFSCSCVETDLGGFPIWSIILGFVSHVMLTLNSSTNLLIYCMVVTRLRKGLVKMVTCGSNSGAISCQCVTESESEQCPLCGRRMMGLKTIQKSGTDKTERKDLGKNRTRHFKNLCKTGTMFI